MEGWRTGNVTNGAFLLSELTAEGLNPVCGFFNGFFYVNASVVRVFGERSGAGAAGIDAAFFGNRPDTPPYVAHPDDVNEEAGARIAERVGWVLSTTEYPELEETKRRCDAARRERPDLSALSDTELVARARSFIPLVKQAFDDHVVTSSNTAIGPTILGQLVPDLMMRLVAGAGDVDSAAPSLAMWTLSRLDPGSEAFRDGFAAFLVEFGARGPNEWDPWSEVWETKPELALALIDRMRAAGEDADPAARAEATVADREAATAEALARFAGDAETSGMLQAAQASALRFNAWRERSKTNCVKAVHEQRVALRELGRRLVERGHLAEPRQVFMALESELDSLLADPASLAPVLSEREGAWRRLWELEPPYFVESDKGIPALEDLHAPGDRVVTLAVPGEVLQGAPGCAGVVEAVARVVLDAGDPFALEPGEILVAPNTDPAWTPLFVPAAGVIVDVGALNSHAVIVSRELGIPCAVSVVDATRRIPDGARVRLDGGNGTVEVL
jgi:pyruvate,water dikinase